MSVDTQNTPRTRPAPGRASGDTHGGQPVRVLRRRARAEHGQGAVRSRAGRRQSREFPCAARVASAAAPPSQHPVVATRAYAAAPAAARVEDTAPLRRPSGRTPAGTGAPGVRRRAVPRSGGPHPRTPVRRLLQAVRRGVGGRPTRLDAGAAPDSPSPGRAATAAGARPRQPRTGAAATAPPSPPSHCAATPGRGASTHGPGDGAGRPRGRRRRTRTHAGPGAAAAADARSGTRTTPAAG